MRTRSVPILAMLGVLMAALALAGPAWAIYAGDGSLPNGTTGGWDITDYGTCVSGIKADGTMVTDAANNTSFPDCLDRVYTGADYDTQAECIATSGRVLNPTDDLSHFWTSNVCVDSVTGAGISLDGLDRTAANCALKGGVRQSACTGSWIYTGPAGNGAPGFCTTTVNLTTLYPDAASCPTGIAGYAWAGSKCTYTYGIAGYANAAINKKDGSGAYAAAGTFVDLSALTQGQCLAAGASWSTGVIKAGTASLATTPLASTVPHDAATGRDTVSDTRAGCLECHNSVSQRNSYAGRWKETYLKTGHKNMLRKVTPGEVWAGPDGVVYTEDASGNPIDFLTGTISVGGVTKDLVYLFGDWMVPAPNSVYDNGGGATNSYSCAACHTTGWSNPDPTKGVCSQSSKTTQAACTAAGGTWYPSSGVQGASYTPPEPLASFPGYTSGITGKWDRDGITCARCHQSVFSQTVPAPAGTSGHHAPVSSGTAELNNTVCFGCHQSPATNYATNDKILDPVQIPTGANHGADAGREFNGHVLGNMFLNSPHARFTGAIVPNSLGKYDLAANTPANYDSTFKGMVCRSSTSVGGGSQLETVWKGGAVAKIHSLEDCNLANGFGTEAAPDSTSRGYWQGESQGNCATCHDVHQSLFDPAAEEPLRRECGITCHASKADWATIKHPMGVGTPIGDGTDPMKPCEICHMPKPTAEGFPMHLWRINTDAAYDTFPSAAAFYGGSCSVDPTVNTTSALCATAGGTWTAAAKDRRAKAAPETLADGSTYAPAVWLDVDLACGQCHGGSAGAGATKDGAPYYDKAYLAFWAEGMHGQGTTLAPTAGYAGLTVTNLAVSFTDSSTDNNGKAQSTLAISVNWGDGTVSAGAGGGVFSHTYTRPGTYTIVHRATDAGGRVNSELIPVTATSVAAGAVKRSITVTVLRADGTTPVQGTRVYLKRQKGTGYAQIRYGYTNASGQLTFANLAENLNYKIAVFKSVLDFNGALRGKQAKLQTGVILLDADRAVSVQQGAAATNGPAGAAWKGNNGGAPAIVVTP